MEEIPFGAFDNELMHQEIFIPEGFTATIDGNKIILTRIENEDERVKKALITYFQRFPYSCIGKAGTNPKEAIAWLKKQGNQKSKKVSIWKHWKDGICGNGEGKLIYLIKNGDAYSLSSSLGFECDYIELSELDNLMLDKQGEQKPTDIYPIFRVGDIIRHKEQGFTCKIIAVDTEYRLSECNGTHLPFDSQDAYELVEHKPAEWSDEDENIISAAEVWLDTLCDYLKDSSSAYIPNVRVIISKLKSLRPQNRWKVVDKGIYVKEPALAQKKDKSEPGQGFVVCYDHTLTPDVYERYIMLSDINCHSGWKPSDKQMEALLSEVNGWVKGCPKQIVLESLYKDLEKLKG